MSPAVSFDAASQCAEACHALQCNLPGAEASGSLVPLERAGFAEPGELAGAPEKQMRQRIGEVVPSSIVCCLIKEWCVKQRPLWHTAALYRDNTKQLRFGGLRSSAYLRFNC